MLATMQAGYAIIVILSWIVNPFPISQAALLSVCNLLLLLITGMVYLLFIFPMWFRYLAVCLVLNGGWRCGIE